MELSWKSTIINTVKKMSKGNKGEKYVWKRNYYNWSGREKVQTD